MYSVRKEGVVGIELTCSVAPGDMEYPEDSILIFLSWQAVNWHTWSDTVDDKIIQVDRPSLLQRGRCSLCSSGVCLFVCIYFLSVLDPIFPSSADISLMEEAKRRKICRSVQVDQILVLTDLPELGLKIEPHLSI